MGGWSYVYFQHVFIHHADRGRRGNLILLIKKIPSCIIGSRGHPDLVVTMTPATFNLADIACMPMDCVITVFIYRSMVCMYYKLSYLYGIIYCKELSIGNLSYSAVRSWTIS